MDKRDGVYDALERQDMGWTDARRYFYQALITPLPTDRNTNFELTFRAVGQVLHLLEDMAVPAHVRNDFQSHLRYNGIDENSPNKPSSRVGNPFEHYIVQRRDLIVSATIIKPNFVAPYVTDFWDTDKTGSVRGLAEITNAKYFSDETIPNNNSIATDKYYLVHKFDEPNIDTGVYNCNDKLPGSTKETKYISRLPCPEPGQPVDHFVALSLMSSSTEKKYYLDDNVHQTYAKEILPQVLGYSQALLEYFFRGSLEVTIPVGVQQRHDRISVKVRNNTSSGEQATDAEAIVMVLRYKLLKEANGQIVEDGEGYHYQVASLRQPEDPLQKINSIPSNEGVQLDFDLSSPIPMWAYDISAQVVFKGKLGNEIDAVAVGRTPLGGIGGGIEIASPDRGVYAIAAPDGSFTEFRVKTANVLPGGEAMTDGDVELVLLYRKSVEDPFQGEPTSENPAPPAFYYTLHAPALDGARAIGGELRFDLSANPLPLWATNVLAYIVYKGQVGATAGAEVWGSGDIAEPTPLDIINDMDYVCVKTDPDPSVTTGNYLVAGSQEAIDAVGVSFTGRPKFDIYPHRLKDVYLGFTSTPASATNYSVRFSAIDPGRYGRIFVLPDYNFRLSSAVVVENINGPMEDTWGLGFLPFTDDPFGIYNQGSYYPLMELERGLKSWWSLNYKNQELPDGTSCSWSGTEPSYTGPVTVEIQP